MILTQVSTPSVYRPIPEPMAAGAKTDRRSARMPDSSDEMQQCGTLRRAEQPVDAGTMEQAAIFRPETGPSRTTGRRHSRHSPLSRIAVEEISTVGTSMKHQAGGRVQASAREFRPGTRKRANLLAAGESRAGIPRPDRAITPIGMFSMIHSHRSQRWKSARLSAPISQTNRWPGQS